MTETHPQYCNTGPAASLEILAARPCCLPQCHPQYHPPSPEEVTALIRLAGWSQVQTAMLCGASYTHRKGSGTIRKWRTATTKSEHRPIPYASWRLLLACAGVIDPKLDPDQLP